MFSYDFSQTKTSKSVLPCMVATLWLTPGGCNSAKYTINTLGFFRGSTFEAKLAKLRRELLTPTSKGGGAEGFDVTKSGDARAGLVGFPSVGKSKLLNKLTGTFSEVASYEFTTLTCIPGVNTYRGAKIQVKVCDICGDAGREELLAM
ncbi:putative GTP binding domain, P-loop containing nucleoside triphosphate hydrolase [Helianthus anomalus]